LVDVFVVFRRALCRVVRVVVLFMSIYFTIALVHLNLVNGAVVIRDFGPDVYIIFADNLCVH